MPRMTEEEADTLDELVTKNPFRVDPSKARRVTPMVALDDLSADYLFPRSITMHKTPSEIINEMVRERIAATGPSVNLDSSVSSRAGGWE